MKHYDAIVIGAGIAGLYQLYCLRQLGMTVRVFEAGGDVGGTWYWNRYPGARFDSESYTYGYSFSKELLQEWNWSEHFAPQPETLRYLNLVADKFSLREDIEFNARIARAIYDEARNVWIVETQQGLRASGRYLITATGVLSAPVIPNLPGRETFKGVATHTANWPHTSLELTGKRVAVIGTGASGVQIIQEAAKVAAQLTVFQRSPNWCTPLRNSAIEPQAMEQIKASYDQIFARCRETAAGFLYSQDPRSALDVSDEERETFFEELYVKPGFSIWQANFWDIFTNEKANATISAFIARKIRERVKDPAIADKLIPTDHGFGTKRVPLETNYFEAYNQDNVELVELKKTPIEAITEIGIRTSDQERPFDVIIFATGFDAIRGSLDRIDIRGVAGEKLLTKWSDGPQTYMGLQIHGFPNLFTLVGPHNGATFCNIPRCIEQNVEFVTEMLRYMRNKGVNRVEASAQAEEAWTERVDTLAQALLLSKVDSYFTSINTNLTGRKKRRILLYTGGQQDYRERCTEAAENSYSGFDMSHCEDREMADQTI
jgi:cation diffusion facilitator CzcD-associated flavoprotein CzcO